MPRDHLGEELVIHARINLQKFRKPLRRSPLNQTAFRWASQELPHSHVGDFPQKQRGFHYVGVAVPVGQLTPKQMGASMVLAFVLFTAVFVVGPYIGFRFLRHSVSSKKLIGLMKLTWYRELDVTGGASVVGIASKAASFT